MSPYPAPPRSAGAHWSGNTRDGWTLCTCSAKDNHPDPEAVSTTPPSVDRMRAALTDLAAGLERVAETCRWDGYPGDTADRLFDCVEPLNRLAQCMRTWPL